MKISIGRIGSFINGIKFANKLSYLRNRVEKHFATEDDSLYSIDVAIVYTKKFTIWSNENEYSIVKDIDGSTRTRQLIFWDKLKSTNYIVDILGTFIDDDLLVWKIKNPPSGDFLFCLFFEKRKKSWQGVV